MSKNTNLSFLTDYITADITNGRIGINNVSPTYVFDVNGTMRTSGATYLATASGNVGIGTTTTEGVLTIKGTSAQPPTSGTTANSLLQLVGSLNNELNIGSNTVAGSYGSYIQASDNNLAVPYPLNLQPNGGSVGIGNGTGTVGTLNVTGRIALTSSLFFSSNLTSEDRWEINVATPANDLYFSRSGVGERMRILSNGNVGIGTSSPTAKLEVNGYGTANSIMTYVAAKFYGAGSGGVNIGTDGTVAMIATDSSGADLTFLTRVSGVFYERIRITSGGNVQIGGTTAGNFALYVKGVSSTNANYALVVNNSTPGDLFFCRNDGLINTGQQSASPYNNADTGRSVIVNSGGTLGYTSSTRESKTNIKQLSDVFWLYQLNPVSFNYRKKDNEMNYTEEFHEEKWYGLIADEVESVNEDLIFYNTKENNVKQLAGVEYSKIVPALVKAIQELRAEIEKLKQK